MSERPRPPAKSIPQSQRLPVEHPDDVLSAPPDEDIGDIHSRYTAPSTVPDGWKMSGLVPLNVAIMAIHMQLLRGSVRTASGIYRRRVTAMRESLAKSVVGWAIGKKLGTAAAKEILKWVTLVFTIWRNAELQKEIENAIRRNALATQRQVNADEMNQHHNENLRRQQKVKTRG